MIEDNAYLSLKERYIAECYAHEWTAFYAKAAGALACFLGGFLIQLAAARIGVHLFLK